MTEEIENVDSSSDDCDESNFGSVDTSSTTMNLNALTWGVGIRFNNVNVPQGATINSATLTITGTYSCGLNGCNSTIYGVDADDTSTWDGNKPSDQTQTTASTSFNKTGTFSPDLSYETWTPSVTSIVQEIVNRGGWVADNSMSFVIEGDSFSKGSGMNLHTFDHASFPEPKLTIDYTAAGRRVFVTIS
jgi:hypothetical protein